MSLLLISELLILKQPKISLIKRGWWPKTVSSQKLGR